MLPLRLLLAVKRCGSPSVGPGVVVVASVSLVPKSAHGSAHSSESGSSQVDHQSSVSDESVSRGNPANVSQNSARWATVK